MNAIFIFAGVFVFAAFFAVVHVLSYGSGLNDGYDAGQIDGFADGYNEGNQDGYDQAFDDGAFSTPPWATDGVKWHCSDCHPELTDNGYRCSACVSTDFDSDDYNEGYNRGYVNGKLDAAFFGKQYVVPAEDDKYEWVEPSYTIAALGDKVFDQDGVEYTKQEFTDDWDFYDGDEMWADRVEAERLAASGGV